MVAYKAEELEKRLGQFEKTYQQWKDKVKACRHLLQCKSDLSSDKLASSIESITNSEANVLQ